MACPRCGSTEGSLARMCNGCINEAQQRHASFSRPPIRSASGRYINEDRISQTSLLAHFITFMFILGLFIAATIAFTRWGPVSEATVVEAALFAGVVLFTTGMLATYLMLWVRMATVDPVVGLLGLLVPFMGVWCWSGLNGDRCGSIRGVHFFSAAAAALSWLAFSIYTQLPVHDVALMAANFTATPSEYRLLQRKIDPRVYDPHRIEGYVE